MTTHPEQSYSTYVPYLYNATGEQPHRFGRMVVLLWWKEIQGNLERTACVQYDYRAAIYLLDKRRVVICIADFLGRFKMRREKETRMSKDVGIRNGD